MATLICNNFEVNYLQSFLIEQELTLIIEHIERCFQKEFSIFLLVDSSVDLLQKRSCPGEIKKLNLMKKLIESPLNINLYFTESQRNCLAQFLERALFEAYTIAKENRAGNPFLLTAAKTVIDVCGNHKGSGLSSELWVERLCKSLCSFLNYSLYDKICKKLP